MVACDLEATNLAWLNVLDARAITVRKEGFEWNDLLQPLDLLCRTSFKWGCRFLTVDHRTLVGRVWKGEAIADLHVALDRKAIATRERPRSPP
jgi:hypothetical protein